MKRVVLVVMCLIFPVLLAISISLLPFVKNTINNTALIVVFLLCIVANFVAFPATIYSAWKE